MTSSVASALPPSAVTIVTDPVTEPFWAAARERRLVAQQCDACGTHRLPPMPFCGRCRSTDLRWSELSGRGVLYSFAVVRSFPGVPDAILVPAVVDLPDAPGARLVTNVVGVPPEDVSIGAELSVDFHPVSDGWLLPVFRLAPSQRASADPTKERTT